VILAGKIRALLQGRYNVAFEDLHHVAMAALRHRVILNFEGEAEGIPPDVLVSGLLSHLTEMSAPRVAVG
jgi:MoxR-like ATPase